MASKKKRLVTKINEELLEFTEDDAGKPIAQKVSDDDVFEIVALENNLQEVLNNNIHKLTTEAYNELTREFKNNLKSTVLRAIGFDNRYNNRWEVDHCNSRNSMLSEFVGKHMRQMVHDELNKMQQGEVAELLKPVKEAIRDDFIQQFREVARREMYTFAHDAAQQFVKTMVQQQLDNATTAATERIQNRLLKIKADD